MSPDHRPSDSETTRESRPTAAEGPSEEFVQACEDAGVHPIRHEALWKLYVAVPDGAARSNRLEWLMEDHAHWQLFESSRQGDEAAARAFEKHWRRIVGAFVGRRLPPQDQEDFFLRFLVLVHERVVERFQWQAPFSAYLRQVMVNAWRDEAAKRARLSSREVELDEEEQDRSETWRSREPSPERQLLARESVAALRSALEELNPIDRRIVLACLVEEQSGQELAAELGMSRGALYQRLHRAKRRLHELVEGRGTGRT
ncbi:MAG: sigma-70 family RNA polymerase sigma factor [Acidobacteriota bacterium]